MNQPAGGCGEIADRPSPIAEGEGTTSPVADRPSPIAKEDKAAARVAEPDLPALWRGALLSRVMRRGLCTYNLPETFQRLAHKLVIESLDEGLTVAPVDLERWARELGFGDQTEVRPDRARRVLESLEQLRIIGWHRAGLEGYPSGPQGVFEPMPYPGHWDKTRGTRSLKAPAGQTVELQLSSDAPLDRALAEVSREKAVGGPEPVDPGLQAGSRDWASLFKLAREALSDPEKQAALEKALSADFSAGGPAKVAGESGKTFRRGPSDKSAGEGRAGNIGESAAAEKSAGLQLASSIASLAPVQRAKLAIAAEKSGGGARKARHTPQEALEYLKGQDRAGTLRGRFGEGYERLCELDPDYVLTRLKNHLEEHLRHYKAERGPSYELTDPVGFVGRKAADEGRMRWHGRRT